MRLPIWRQRQIADREAQAYADDNERLAAVMGFEDDEEQERLGRELDESIRAARLRQCAAEDQKKGKRR